MADTRKDDESKRGLTKTLYGLAATRAARCHCGPRARSSLRLTGALVYASPTT